MHRPDNPLPQFTSSYEDLLPVTNSQNRTALLSLMLNLSEQENKLPLVMRYNYREMNGALDRGQANTKIRQVSNSSDLEKIYRNLTLKNPTLSTTSNSNYTESRLRMVNHSRKPNFVSSDHSSTNSTENLTDSSSQTHLIQEIIYILTGKVGKYLKKDITGEFKLDIKARNLSMREAGILLRMAELGYNHNEIEKYTDLNSEYFLCGLFGQGLISHVEAELTEFYALVAMLQESVRTRNF